MAFKRKVKVVRIIDKALEMIKNSPSNMFDDGFIVQDIVSIIRFKTDSKIIPHPSTVRHYLMLKKKRGEVDIIVRSISQECRWGFVDNGDGDGARPKEDRA